MSTARRFAVLALALFSALSWAQTREELVKKALDDYIAANKVVGATVAILKADGTLFTTAAGFQDRESNAPATEKTVYRIGSVSKVVTTIAALQLVQEGKLSLFSNVSLEAPEWTNRDAGITLRHLLTHTSGIRHYTTAKFDVYYKPFTPAESLDVFKDDPLLFKPGERVSYSTHAFSLVARIVETADGRDFATAVRARISDLAGATTLALEDRSAPNPDRTKLYTIANVAEPLLETLEENISWKSGGGGMECSAPDLARFGLAAMGGRLLDTQMTDFMFQRQVVAGLETDRGLGWDFSPFGEPAHGGAQQGCRCQLVLDRVNGTVYAIMTNTGGSHPIGQITVSVINAWGERKIGSVPEAWHVHE